MTTRRPSDVVSFDNDKRLDGLPRELARRKSGAAPRQPALWTSPETRNFGDAPWGAYPKAFLAWATRLLHCAPPEVLHMCSGGLARGHGRARVDIRPEVLPDVVADARALTIERGEPRRGLPFRDGTFAAALIDPPYSVEYSRDLYGTEYPRPAHLLAEASRVVRPCGRIGIVHFIVPMPPPGCRLEMVRGVTTGCGYRIRALTVFVRDQDGLELEPRP